MASFPALAKELTSPCVGSARIMLSQTLPGSSSVLQPRLQIPNRCGTRQRARSTAPRMPLNLLPRAGGARSRTALARRCGQWWASSRLGTH